MRRTGIAGHKGMRQAGGVSVGAAAGEERGDRASMKGLKYANNVEELGKETVDGPSTTHYRARLDQARLGKFKDAPPTAETGDLSEAVKGAAGER